MRKVIPIRTMQSVQDICCESADKGFVEILVVGKCADGTFELTKSPLNSSVEIVGILEMAKQWCLECMS